MPARKDGQKRQRSDAQYRIRVVEKLLIRGASRSEIHEAIRTKFGISTRTIDDYIARAKQGIVDSFDEDRKAYAGQMLARMNLVCKMGFAEKNLSAVIQATQVQCRITGIGQNSP